MDYNQPLSTNQSLIDHLEHEVGVFQDSRVHDAFQAVDRADFIPEDYRPEAYEDYALPIYHGQTISQPTTVAFMLEKLAVAEGDRVLDVGSGSGWSTALLAHMVGKSGHVVGVEVVAELADFGRQNIEKYGFTNASIAQSTDSLGKRDNAPFDKILVSAAAEVLPEALIEQLAKGGRMVIPVQDELMVVNKLEDGSLQKEAYPGFTFVPLQNFQ